MVQLAKMPIEINGRQFATVREAALHHGVTLKAIGHQIRHYGLSLEQAFAVVVSKTHGTERRTKAEQLAAEHLKRGNVIDLWLLASPQSCQKGRRHA